jgi:hypothetical protein
MARAFTGAGKFEGDCVLICEILRRGGGSTGITAGEVLMNSVQREWKSEREEAWLGDPKLYNTT